ncbi:MAG: homoserine O-acetyltransferase [Bacteroidales bacterium]|nr:homoserine O-acetyltransferase [Bacteroidales bacterium]
MSHTVYKHKATFELELGQSFSEIDIAYHAYGELNAGKSNVVWICHAYTANSDPMEWWPGMVGRGKFFDPDKHFIICANILGSCYGTTGPLSINPETEKSWFRSFPEITVRDMAHAHILLANHLGIDKIHILIGASVGGHQAMEWAICQPDRIRHLKLLVTNASFSPWAIAFNASQRMAIEADSTFFLDRADGGLKGLAAARSIALLSYRNATAYNLTQKETETDKTSDFKVESYQRYQGEKLIRRFNAYSYYILSKSLDNHNVARGRNSFKEALGCIEAKTLIIGITTDMLIPVEEQKLLEAHIPNSRLEIIHSDFGHDGFLLENEILTKVFNEFIYNLKTTINA